MVRLGVSWCSPTSWSRQPPSLLPDRPVRLSGPEARAWSAWSPVVLDEELLPVALAGQADLPAQSHTTPERAPLLQRNPAAFPSSYAHPEVRMTRAVQAPGRDAAVLAPTVVRKVHSRRVRRPEPDRPTAPAECRPAGRDR